MQRGVTVLCFYLLSQLDDRGDGLRGCQKPRGSSPSSISHPDGVRWGEKGSAVKSNGINPEGAFVPGGKTQCLRDRSAERAEKMCQGEKRNQKRGKKKKQDVLSGAVVEDRFMRHKDKEVKANGVQCLTFTAVKQLLSFHFSSPSVCTFR